MNLMNILLDAGSGGSVDALGKQFGLSGGQTKSAVEALLPALMGGLKKNTQSESGLAGLIGALQTGNHQRYLDDANLVGQSDTVQEGNAILGHLLGNKEASRQVAANASSQTGIGDDILKKMLPVIATMAMGAMSKKTQTSGGENLLSGLLGGQSGGANPLMGLLDTDGDGDVVDNVLDLAGRFLKR